MKSSKSNLGFLISFFCSFLLGGILLFFIEKGAVVLFFNEHRTDFWTNFFYYFTKMGEEWAYVLSILIFSFLKKIRVAIAIALTGFMTMIVSFAAKSFFHLPRPITFFSKKGLLNDILIPEGHKIYQGYSAFPSGHTMSAFALFGLIALLLNGRNLLGFVFFSIAFLVGLSRIYLFHHFYEDVFFGALCGFLIAILFKKLLDQKHFLNGNLDKV